MAKEECATGKSRAICGLLRAKCQNAKEKNLLEECLEGRYEGRSLKAPLTFRLRRRKHLCVSITPSI